MEESKVVPEAAMDAVKASLSGINQLKADFQEFLKLSHPDVLAQMDPLQRAQTLLALAKTATTLYTLKLRCTGVHPDDHPIKTELERLSLYEDKLERAMDLSKAPLRPSATLNYQAATRFIEHSLPDLTSEQRQRMREIGHGEGVNAKSADRNATKKRKFRSSEKQSVRAAAQEFLEKAARELIVDNNSGFKGPLQIDASDDEDMSVP
ncbi:hypothetical protein RJ641_006241 [Dillenia turbinata]|uniref:Nuclear nucleic acid-binding protein C1D n=1 Tax=Dillenia turbinata TaxID=194707 RepID=A0AAN8V507_9MAGN